MQLTRLVTASLVLASSVALVAQQPATFHAETNFVELDAIVTDRLGHFVPGLTAADFTVREGRTVAPVEVFDTVDLPVPGRTGAGAISPARVDPGAGLPSGSLDGRIYLLYFDLPLTGENIINAKRRGREFITQYLQPGDVAGVWSRQNASTVTFTNDQSVLLAEVSHLAGGPTASSGSVGATTGRLMDAAELLRSIQGRRKSMLLFTAGQDLRTPILLNRPVSRPSDRDLTLDRFSIDESRAYWQNPLTQAIDLRPLADVHIYPIDVRGLTTPPPGTRPGSPAFESALLTSDDWLRTVADQTGGRSVVQTNDFSAGFQQILEDNSRYYVLGYQSPRATGARGFVAVTVAVKSPDLAVRARSGYVR